MAWALTTNHAANTGAASFSISAAAYTAGDLMVIYLGNFNANSLTVTVASDTVGTSYNRSLLASGGGDSFCLIWGYLAASGASGTNTFTGTWSTGSSSFGAYGEFSGAAGSSLDKTGTATGTAAACTTPSVTTVFPSDLIVQGLYAPSASAAMTFGGSWSTAASNTNGGLAYQLNVGAGSYSPSVTWTTSSAFGSIVASWGTPPPNTSIPHRMPLGA